MSLTAILFDLSGVIVDDSAIHEALINEILLSENLRPMDNEFTKICLGKSDRTSLRHIFKHRGRFPNLDSLKRLLKIKSQGYCEHFAQLAQLPIYPDVRPCLETIRALDIPIALVASISRETAIYILERSQLIDYFSFILGDDDLFPTAPDSEAYQLALTHLQQQFPEKPIQASTCLAIAANTPSIQAIKEVNISAVGVAHRYPFHMLQRQTNWCIDNLDDLELERIQETLKPAR